jgi:hypothetical protein
MRRFCCFLTIIFLIFLTACGSVTPPKEFAPDGEIVQKALLLQFRHTSNRLSQSLQIDDPQAKIAKINVISLEPIYVGKLPAYHLQGDYDLILKLPRQKDTKQHNNFDLYLQRQIEGKTWRLLEQVESQWRSYLVE